MLFLLMRVQVVLRYGILDLANRKVDLEVWRQRRNPLEKMYKELAHNVIRPDKTILLAWWQV